MSLLLLEVLQKVADELPGCELTSVASLETGLSLAAASPGGSRDASESDAFGAQLYRLLGDALKEAGAAGGVDDVVLIGELRICVVAQLASSGYFWQVSTRADTALGFTQAVMRKFQGQVVEGVTALLG